MSLNRFLFVIVELKSTLISHIIVKIKRSQNNRLRGQKEVEVDAGEVGNQNIHILNKKIKIIEIAVCKIHKPFVLNLNISISIVKMPFVEENIIIAFQ